MMRDRFNFRIATIALFSNRGTNVLRGLYHVTPRFLRLHERSFVNDLVSELEIIQMVNFNCDPFECKFMMDDVS